ncbi:MAG: AtpZ/AtpI family protein [Planctomycetes bacterium]|nr:AtpZ/AtpI family protein [Planctomycetota bacterium]
MSEADRRQRDAFQSGVRRRRERVEEGRRSGERSLAQNLALIGSLGWLVVVPTLLGIYVGRRLDGAQGTGLLWTGALLLAGLTLGCWLAWKRVHEA